MRPLYDEFDDFDFADSAAVNRALRKQKRARRRLVGRRYAGPEDEDEVENYEDYEDYNDYDDYNDDEFDKYSGVEIDY